MGFNPTNFHGGSGIGFDVADLIDDLDRRYMSDDCIDQLGLARRDEFKGECGEWDGRVYFISNHRKSMTNDWDWVFFVDQDDIDEHGWSDEDIEEILLNGFSDYMDTHVTRKTISRIKHRDIMTVLEENISDYIYEGEWTSI